MDERVSEGMHVRTVINMLVEHHEVKDAVSYELGSEGARGGFAHDHMRQRSLQLSRQHSTHNRL